MWSATTARLVALIVGLGAVAFLTTGYQRAEFEDTTSQLRVEMTAFVRLDRALIGVEDPATRLIYSFGGPEQREANIAEYRAARDEVNASFDGLDASVSTPRAQALADTARTAWTAADTAVLAALETDPGLVAEQLASGSDPFREPVWNNLNRAGQELTELRSTRVDELREHMDDVNRVQRWIPPLVVGAVGVALTLAWATWRRISRRVVTPILELREAAAALRSSEAAAGPLLSLEEGTAELQDLAVVLNETAASLRASHSLLRDQANTDALTGLPNRKSFAERLQLMFDAAADDTRIAVLFIDLDDFKIVNDTRGHAAGDELLRVIAQRLLTTTRQAEVVSRLGGDEFALAIDCTGDAGAPTAIAERIVAALGEPVVLDSGPVTVGCSVGVAVEQAATVDTVDELLRNADFAMYMAKGQGKNRYEVYSPSMHAALVARTNLRRELGRAVRSGQFVLEYQPVIDLESEQLLGFEALIRWDHPERGRLAPGEFIALAEDTGDIVEIGTWVLDEACCTLAEQLSDGARLWMSVNVSALQLEFPGFVDVVLTTLQRHHLDADLLVIEITEAVAITNSREASATLAQLREAGVHVALDDFGIGFSSLSYLHELPVDVLKIDRSFVALEGRENDSTLQAIVSLGRSLGLELIAEGIERPGELDRLRAYGGGLSGQGYLFARPMSATEAVAFAGEQRGRHGSEGAHPADRGG